MKLVLHLMKKDAYRLRWDLSLYALFVFGAAATVTLGIRPTQNAWWWFLALQTMLIVAIGAQLVQVDALVGTTTFWRTRPISRSVLLTSKASLAVVALMVLPALVTAAVGRINGLWWRDVLITACSAIVAQAVVVVPVLAVASVTSTLSAFVLVGVVAFAGSAGLRSFVAEWVQPSILLSTWSPSLFASRDVALVAGLLISAAIVLPIQALTLRIRRTVIVGVIAHSLFVFSAAAWSWDFLSRTQPPVDPAVLDPRSVKLEFHPDRVVVSSAMTPRGMRETEKQVIVGVSWSGVPEGLVVTPVAVHASFRDARGFDWRYDQSPISRSRAFRSYQIGNESHRVRALALALGGVRWLNGGYAGEGGVMATVLQVSNEQFRQLEGQRGALTLQLDFAAARFTVAGAAPLASGARFTTRGDSVTIRRAYLAGSEEGRTLLMDVHETQTTRFFIGLGWDFSGQIVVRNGPRREALFADPMPVARSFDLRYAEPIPYHLVVRRQLFGTRTSSATQLNQSWLDQSELVRLEPTVLGRFTLTLRVDDFVLKATANQ